MPYGSNIFFLPTSKPRGVSRVVLIAWGAMLILLILAPGLVDRLLWFPSHELFSITGLLLLPAVWGHSAAVSMVGLLASSALFWFFGDDVERRMGRRLFLKYLALTSGAGFAASYLWARIFAGHPATAAPFMAWALAFAACRLHAGQMLAWRNYGLGHFGMLTVFLLGAAALFLLLSAAGDEPMDQAVGALATLATAAFWFDPHWVGRLRAHWKLRRGRFGKRNGFWGYN